MWTIKNFLCKSTPKNNDKFYFLLYNKKYIKPLNQALNSYKTKFASEFRKG